jgi:hypothetical protein
VQWLVLAYVVVEAETLDDAQGLADELDDLLQAQTGVLDVSLDPVRENVKE